MSDELKPLFFGETNNTNDKIDDSKTSSSENENNLESVSPDNNDEELKPLFFNNDEERTESTEINEQEELRPLFGSSNQSTEEKNNHFSGSTLSDLPDDFVPIQRAEGVAEIKNKNSNFVFFFGTSASGKSVILSSMLYALRSRFGVIRPQVGTPNSRESMVLLSDFFENISRGILPERTTRDQVTRMDLVFEPNNKSKKVKPINLTFLETAGENHNEIRRGGQYHSSVSQYLKADIPITFLLVTGINSAHQEDSLLSEFLFLLENEGRNLRNINLILVISKWDLSGTQKPTSEELDFFVKERLPMTYQFLETKGLPKTYYTIGQLDKNNQNKINSLNLDSAENLSKWLYKSIAGIKLDYEGSMIEQLKWSIGLK